MKHIVIEKIWRGCSVKLSMGVFVAGIVIHALLCTSAFAVCSGSSPKLVAASANRGDVADCVAASSYGDTISIPACAAGACVWASGITITKDIKIVGAGAGKTYLTNGFTNNSTEEGFFKFTPDATARVNIDSLSDTNTFEVSGISFYYSGSRMTNKFGVWIYSFDTPVIRRVRVHHNTFTNIHRAVQVVGYVHGVFDSNILVNSNGSYPQGAGLGMFANDVMTLGRGDGWYIEDNTFSFSGVGTISGAGNNGGGHVIRYNTSSGTHDIYVETHSNQLGLIKGGQITEVYGNKFASTATQGIDIRGGKAMIFFNKDNDDSHHVREEFADSYSGTLPNNMCAASSPQICTNACVCWKVHDSYFWNNRNLTTNALQRFMVMNESTTPYDKYDNTNTNDPRELLENREYFTQRAGIFDGTGSISSGGGVGCGTLSSMPSTCTPGVAYWATDQSCSDLGGMVGVAPSTPILGTLYKCIAPNTWAAYYTPYTYPHPLRTGGGVALNPPTLKIIQ